METVAIAFGKTLRELRKQAKLTQEQLGFEADIQRIYVSKLELGQQQPSLTTLFKLASGLHCMPSEMLRLVELKMQELESKK